MKCTFLSFIILFSLARASADGLLTETWESVPAGPFNGSADVEWMGDTNDFLVSTATWPSGPDLMGTRSLRSGNGEGGVPSTILTDVSDIYSATSDITWSVFLSGNSASISTGKRVDLVLLSSSANASVVEAPVGLTGYKLCLWDPLNSGGAGHGPAQLSYSISLWKVGPGDTVWKLLAAHEFGTSVDVRSGWRITVTRTRASRWQVAWTNGPSTNSVGPPIFDVADDHAPAAGQWYSGLGLLSTATDLGDFGFDEFRVDRRPENLALSGFVRAEDSIQLSVDGLAPGRQVMIEECFDLQCATGWHSVSTFLSGQSSTNVAIPVAREVKAAYYRARVD